VLRGALDGSLGGSGSGLDADTVDGVQAAALAKLAGDTFTGAVTFESLLTAKDGIEGRLPADTFSPGSTPSDWPTGMSWQAVTSGPWVVAAGKTGQVSTWNFGSTVDTWQLFVDRGVSGGLALYHRRWSSLSSWTTWQQITTADNPGAWEVDNSTEVSGPVALGSSFSTVASVSLTIPSDWNEWKCYAHAEYGATSSSSHFLDAKIVIDGTSQQIKRAEFDGSVADKDSSVSGRRTGMTTTGSRTVSLQCLESGVNVIDAFLYARAVRTA